MYIRFLRLAAFVVVFFTSFRLFAATPTAITSAATSITTTSALLNGAGVPNGEATTGWFRISSTSPGTCNDTFGTRVPATGGTDLGAGASSVAYSITTTGLSAGVTYYFCAIVANGSGTALGNVLSFTTPAPPAVVTNAPTNVSSGGATLQGSANPGASSSTGWFRYSTSNPGTCSDSFGTRAPSSGGTSLGSGTSDVNYTQTISGLVPGATYYYCAIAGNGYGTGFGAIQSFTTLPNAPSVSTSSATLVTGSGATLNGSANPGGDATTGWFRYGTASPGTCNDTFGVRVPGAGGSSLGAGTTSAVFSQPIIGLSPATTYYYCAIASNSAGTSFGAVLSFTTPAPPTVTTSSASSITNTSAYLYGSGNPNRATTMGYFRYSLTNPGTCDDTFGSRAPASGGSNLGSGSSAVGYAQQITGLSPGTTYYYCAIASNGEGTGFGTVMSFSTLSPPAVTTSAASPVAATSATLNGSANPNGNSTYGYYRYATTNPGACNNTFGTATSTTYLGAGTSDVDYTKAIAGLMPGTTYYFCAVAYNSYGYGYGAVLSFTTPAAAPAVSTSSATLVTATGATLNGSANPGGDTTTGWFRYSTASPGTCNDTFGSRAPASGGSSLGAGTTSAPFSQAITGLTPSTTYYYCAIAQNSVGTGFGAVLSFKTPAPPTATTVSATSITNTSATLNGSGNPNGAATTGYFRYALTDPGTCDDTFGSRAPVTGGSNLGSGSSAISFAQTLTGLSAGTTYYYCAITASSEGTAFGAVLSFSTPSPPAVTTSAASPVGSTSATLNGSAAPNGNGTYAYYRYATTSPGACNNTFGTATGSQYLGTGTSAVGYAQNISGLLPGTTYYFCAVAYNSYGYGYGAVLSFTTPATAPSVITSSATAVGSSAATLNGSANPNGDATTGWFRYSTASPGTCDDSFGTRAPEFGSVSIGGGASAVPYAHTITGLSPGTTYYYCAIAQNSIGTSFGVVLSFKTTTPPTVSTLAATPVTASTATLNASVNPNGFTTTGWFRYSTTNPGACDTTFGTATATSSLGSGSSALSMSQSLSGLSPGTTYYFCAVAQSSVGTSLGAVLSFTTPAAPPSVTTVAASSITDTTATLNATANPNGAATTGWFRYSTSNPGTCNDVFGARVPATGGTDLFGGTSPVPYTQPLTGLSPGTTYYFCAIASSSAGSSVGSLMSFTTSNKPSVTTVAASAVNGSSATLNGSADPNASATDGWFRYSTTNPGTCNDTFGTRAPAIGGAALGAGSSAVSFSQALTGLTSGTTYYFCAIAQNVVGTSFGAVLSFTTAKAPTVTTAAATNLTATSATINGSASPNLLTATGWFRYGTTNPGTCNDTFGTRAPTSGGAALGAGASPVAYAQTLSGLAASTTYYYCAIASNSAGTGFGTVMSFTTANAPTVTTSAATSVTTNGATLNGAANPNNQAATGWFRYSTNNPGTCNDTFGTRAPASGGAALGAGSSAVPYAQAITGLTSGVTYYFCAIASNAQGTRFGAVLSFTTTAPPTVATAVATTVASTTASINGAANPNGSATTGWFRYSTTNPGACNDTFGTRAPASGGSSLGSGTTAVGYAEPLTGLTPGTTYYFCAIASNVGGTGFGAVLSFTTPAAPIVTTSGATAVSGSGAILNGSANPSASATTGWFRYSTTNPGACNDTFGTRAPASGGASLGSGSSAVPYSQAITGLTAGTTYYYCAIASNASGTGFGAVLSFTTGAPPSVTTSAASAVTGSSATLNGAANPNGTSATGWFRYSATNPGACNDTFGTRAPASAGSSLGSGSSAVAFSQPITGLQPGTTYYFCAIAQNGTSNGFGAVMSFTTTAAPVVTTNLAGGVASTTATLNGSANPNNQAATGWFRYSTTNPGTCDDTFGTRAPASGGTSLGSGSANVAFLQVLTGLDPGTTYYYCAIAQNGTGTSFGAVLSFSTSSAPSVTTTAATAVTSNGATLNGSADPNGAASSGWFRYSATDPGTCNDTFGIRAPTTGGTALGNGSSAVPYARTLTGLMPGTTYYYCAIASNAVGVGFGAVMSFTTSAAPIVMTDAATSVVSDSATLNGTALPNQDATTGWFRYDTTHPGTCDDTFGTRAPASGGTALGAGGTPVPFSEVLANLAPGTTYYYCAIAANSLGTSFGSVQSFTTPGAPTVITKAATAVTIATATLNASANPNLVDATGWFRYDTTDPGTCNETFGVRAPANGGAALGNGDTPVDYTQDLKGLLPGTTYYYCAIASNAVGVAFGEVMSFTTSAPPSVTTDPATSVLAASAILNATANPNSADTTGWFRYDTVAPAQCDDTFGVRAPMTGGTPLGNGSSPVTYAEPLVGLSPATTYYYCAIVESWVDKSFGEVLSFTTTAEPAVTTKDATDLTATTATLNGSANPNMQATTAWFRFSSTDPGQCDDTFGTRVPATGGTDVGAGSSDVDYAEAITDLAPATTYYFCAIASSADGTAFGEVLTFTTPADPPSVTTDPPTNVQADSAVLNGSADPNGDATTGWFRYDTTDPGACDDNFGVRVPATGGTDLGGGIGAVSFSEAITGLTPGITYYYCAVAANAQGTRFGEIVSFVPDAAPPDVTTEDATDVQGTTATLQGTANPHGSDATGWFRYGDTDPGTCDDSFGTKVPATDGVALGAGDVAVDFSQPLEGLEPKKTYYYCAAAGNIGGATFGKVLSFTTGAAPPTVTTTPATLVEDGSVTLNGSANPNGDATTGWFRYDTTDPGSCDDSFGKRVPDTDGTDLGDGIKDVSFSEAVAILPAGTYYYCAIASNEGGTAFGEVLSFDVPEGTDSSPSTDSGCGCHTVGAGEGGGSVASLAALLLLALRRRRSAA